LPRGHFCERSKQTVCGCEEDDAAEVIPNRTQSELLKYKRFHAMKTISILTFLIASTSFTHGKSLTPASEDSIASNSSKGPRHYQITLDMGIFPWNSNWAWRPSFSVRLGLGIRVLKNSSLFGYVDYYKYKLVEPSGLPGPGFSPLPANREDLAIYAVISAPIFKVGFGAYYTHAPSISWRNPPPFYDYPLQINSSSTVRWFLTVGLHYELYLSDALFIPLELSSKGNDYGTDIDPDWIARVGLGYQF
jgi:hypothetical protein